MTRKIIYISQMGAWWALSEAEWAECIRRWFSDETWEYGKDVGRELAHRPKGTWRDEDSSKYYFDHPVHVAFYPLDWDNDDWRTAAEEAGLTLDDAFFGGDPEDAARKRLLATGWTAEKTSLYDEEGVEGWRWEKDGREINVIGDHAEPAPVPDELLEPAHV